MLVKFDIYLFIDNFSNPRNKYIKKRLFKRRVFLPEVCTILHQYVAMWTPKQFSAKMTTKKQLRGKNGNAFKTQGR